MNKRLYYLILPILGLGIWIALTATRLISPLFLPQPIAVVRAFFESVLNGGLFQDLLATGQRLAVGFLGAVLVGTPIGLLMGFSSRIYAALEFSVEFFRGIPTTALFPLFLLIFGIDDASKVAVIMWGAGLIIVVNTMHGVHQSKELRRRVAQSMHVTGFSLFKHVIFPEALPQIMTGYRVALSLALALTVVTEMFIGTNQGLGHRIMEAQLVYNTADLYNGILATGLLGLLLNKALQMTETKVIHWKGK